MTVLTSVGRLFLLEILTTKGLFSTLKVDALLLIMTSNFKLTELRARSFFLCYTFDFADSRIKPCFRSSFRDNKLATCHNCEMKILGIDVTNILEVVLFFRLHK